jgi:glucose-6-phosphate 1-dehydrogenase
MVDTKHPDEAPCSNVGAERKAVEPCTIVIFGASGDLTARKLIPAFYHLLQGQADAAGLSHRRLCAAREDR